MLTTEQVEQRYLAYHQTRVTIPFPFCTTGHFLYFCLYLYLVFDFYNKYLIDLIDLIEPNELILLWAFVDPSIFDALLALST